MGKYLNEPDLYIIIAGVIMGTLARFFTLRVDYRQIPTYPSAYFNNIVMGFIASALGAIAIPAVLTGDFVSITFLTVA
ncbi:MAG TPA: YIEGIA domain-containing protein, partial [Clostridia bacterium]|nr:YIEGIA domain-containing protein [Clostridia bacterium]